MNRRPSKTPEHSGICATVILMTNQIACLVVAGILAAVVGPSLAAQQPAPIDVTKLGPQVGQRIPEFSLKDQSDKVWTRQTVMGPKGAMLVFFRSADW